MYVKGVIVCPITTTEKEKTFFIPISSNKLHASRTAVSKVNTNQVFSLDYTEQENRNIQFVDSLVEESFYHIVQMFMYNFSFKI
ncbi:type II toxin-antitoxin system PemK/MazF family toxin [Desemzia sp. RIT804]|uniref:type II toxin-antitoxin system PemK/MazF family toxin n=1 Tax=Desemzia sp. RIT 804 TaxID=2810209 RepID=UPI00195087A0|nr:type II toxin-antitoxin system PemK/MazF family toxin [Desemzia sp. RIT 804]